MNYAKDCGCHLNKGPQYTEIKFCALHGAAEQMRDALRRFAIVGGTKLKRDATYLMCDEDIHAARAALAAAEGR